MALDRTGTWHDLCDIRACKDDQVEDGVVETDVFLLGTFHTVRLHVCARHRDQLAVLQVEAAAA